MIKTKPSILCAGLFEHRHQTLLHHLSEEFDITLFLPNRHFSIGRKFEPRPYKLAKSDIRKVSQKFWKFISSIEQEFEIKENLIEKRQVVKHLTLQWVSCQNVRLSLRQLFKQRPIKAVLVVNDHLGPLRTVVETAKEFNCSSIFIDHGFALASFLPEAVKYPEQVILPETNCICVDNKIHREILEKFYFLHSKKPEIFVTGNLLDSKKKNGQRKRKNLKILYCPSWWEANSIHEILLGNFIEHRAFEQFCQTIHEINARFGEDNVEILINLHPTLRHVLNIDNSNYFIANALKFGIKNLTIDSKPVSDLLESVDLVVTSRNSSVTWEAFKCRVPSITYLSNFYKEYLHKSFWFNPTWLAKIGYQIYFDESKNLRDLFRDVIEKKKRGFYEELYDQYTNDIEHINLKEACKNLSQIIKSQIPKINLKAIKNNRLKILEIVHDFPPYSFSGTELYTLHLSQEFKKQGHEVTVLYPKHLPDEPPFVFKKEEYEGLNVLKFNIPTAKNRSDFLNENYHVPFENFLKKNPFDIVHFQHLYGLSVDWINIAKESGSTVFLKIDDMFFYCRQLHLIFKKIEPCTGPSSIDKCVKCISDDFEQIQEDPHNLADRYYYLAYRKTYLKKIFQKVDFVQSTSFFLKETMLKYGFYHGNFHVIRTGIKPFKCMPKKPASDNKIRMAYMGYIHKRKGIMDFISAAERFNRIRANLQKPVNITFLIYGNHFNDKIFFNVLNRISLYDNIIYRGPFQMQDRPKIFSEIDVLVIPSLGENYPFIIREALYAGVPVIATEIAAIPEIIQPNKNGLLYPPGNIESLTKIFFNLAEQPSKIQEMADYAINHKNTITTIEEEAHLLVREFLHFYSQRKI